ncbi:kinetochore protein NUF2 homolog [Triticum dicoccoides]|uniref:kinetochore protein NUF2 homolog n=1 Tax=Triticum dicoccoides TaxID=85692 RepID=UPI0008436D1E|nr:kinetochore protein NUF2 homolog [Triticum dicoccoides]
MASGFHFPLLPPAKIAEQLVEFDVAPFANLRAEHIASPQPDLLPGVLGRFFDYFVDAPGDGEGGQLGFSELEVLDNPEHHEEAIRLLRLYSKSQAFLESIHYRDLTLADFTHPTPRRVVEVLSALINFLLYRHDKTELLQPIVSESSDYHERDLELKARIAQVQKEIADHELAEQMEEPMAQQLEVDVNALQQKVQVYNKQQLALRAKAAAISDKKEEIDMKITQADFELTKHAQENSKLRSKLVKSPEKVQRALEEKKSARAKLKESEKIATQNAQEKTGTLEIRNKAHEKLVKQHSKIQDVHEQLAAAKTVEKEVKTRKAKLNDESVSVMSFEAQIVEWKGKVHEMEERLKAKVKERNQIIADENQKLGALSSETEVKLQCLEPREKKVEAMIAKASKLCSETASARTSATAQQQKIHAKFNNIVKAFNTYMDSVDPFLERVEEVGRQLAGECASAPDPSAAVATKATPRSSTTSKKSRARRRT